jgi:hypothetical protein
MPGRKRGKPHASVRKCEDRNNELCSSLSPGRSPVRTRKVSDGETGNERRLRYGTCQSRKPFHHARRPGEPVTKKASPRRKSNSRGLTPFATVVCLLQVFLKHETRYRYPDPRFFFNSRGDPQLSGRCRSNPTPRRCRRPARPIVRLRLIAHRASITNLKVTAGISVLGCPPTG